MSNVIVIGGGPAGMMAAYTAATNGSTVTLIEKNEKLGRKLMITGKGRCNVTNNCTETEFIENVPVNGRFLYSAISTFTSADTISFFEGLGVSLKTERGRRVFPQSDKACDIVFAMRRAVIKSGVKLVQDTVLEILEENGAVSAVKCKRETYFCDAVILATGGLSYPLTGSTGDGYKFAQRLGHTVVSATPSLVPLETENRAFHALSGLSLKNIEVTLKNQKGKAIFSDFGELLFTHFGLSGPVVLSASSHIPRGEKCKLCIDLKPALTEAQLDARLLREFDAAKNMSLKNVIPKLLPSSMAEPFCEYCGLDSHTPINEVTRQMRLSIIQGLKSLCFEITALRPIDEAIITSGGIKVSEINPKTMESKIVSGLYFAGEVIDVNAYTGGYNLQIAFSTGYLAGISV